MICSATASAVYARSPPREMLRFKTCDSSGKTERMVLHRPAKFLKFKLDL